MAPQMHPDLALKNLVCVEIESILRVEACYLLKQEGPLLVGMKNGSPIYISLQKSNSVYANVLAEGRVLIVNDVGKDRESATQIRASLGITRLINCMFIPIGKSIGKQGGGHLMLLINRLAQDAVEEENKGAAYENFNVHLTPCFKPNFKELLVHVLRHNILNIAKN